MKREIDIPDGVDITLNGDIVKVNGPRGSLERRFYYPNVKVFRDDKKIVVESDEKYTRKEQKAMLGTFASHISNMIIGVTKGFEYNLKMVYSHFPIQLEVKNNSLYINNFLGEKSPRVAHFVGDTKVKIDKDIITISGINKEDVGQTAANIEAATKIKRKDPRVFQDGIYLIKKGK
ncbi:MAG: 50S ribosomal protein L6 [Candidatus Methanoliparum thermophilum]|uniref:Large ribosomal subunit protein uL6 n=1 Tax=Methanoliparum thermophilum TaxID=2491083 RepID=A0A520KTV4_METT2|nr:50S ribosomal protein L6 [Candidatus Methanoliparum sp. LAM-1]RZN65512.1 MAG: 50S ribosomal protein L6 [Candidatus Methanoliparum thermophilum]BDC35392.1 50S ribosomal protein L6 [Candidatus Methanoliparum sp. LAM-1]